MSRPAEKPASGKMPADIAAKIRAIGPVIDPPRTAAVYAPIQAKEPYAGVRIARDVKYGPDARQALDIFIPEGIPGPLPVFMFVHGGGYVGGHKREGSNFFYDNVMLWAARNGMVGVNLTYRLAPAHTWPAGAEDVGAAVAWVIAFIAKYGGDPKKIFLTGHSAGATHVATYVAMPQFHAPGGVGLAGALLLSGNYDLSSGEPDERYAAYFGADKSKYADRSPLKGLLATPVPLLAAHTELEPPPLLHQSELLLAALEKAGRKVHHVFLPNHNHLTITYSINTDDTLLSDEMLAFVRANG